MRISSALLLAFALAACGRDGGNQALVNAEAEARAGDEGDGQVACALAGATAFARTCTVERQMTARGLMLTLRHPDGGFHRLLVTKDGRGVAAADGAEPAKVRVVGADEIEVAIGRDRYRLPATVRHRPGA